MTRNPEIKAVLGDAECAGKQKGGMQADVDRQSCAAQPGLNEPLATNGMKEGRSRHPHTIEITLFLTRR